MKTFTANISAILLLVLSVLSLSSCDDSFEDAASGMVETIFVVDLPDDVSDADLKNEKLTLRNVSSGRVQEFSSTASPVSLIPGLYDVTYEAEMELASGAVATLRAAATSVSVTAGNTKVELKGYSNIETDDLIIAEVFFSGTLRSSGNQYNGDDYIKLLLLSDKIF